MMCAWIAAPRATTSSGFRSACGGRPNSSSTEPAHQRDPRRPADQDRLVDLRRLQPGVGERQAARLERAVDDRADEALELVARERGGGRAALRAGAPGRPRGSRSRRCSDRSHFAWMTACRIAWSRLGSADIAEADLGERPAHEQLVDVVAAEVRVAVGRQHLEDAVLDAQDRDVERAAAEVVDGDDAARCAGRGRRPARRRSAR